MDKNRHRLKGKKRIAFSFMALGFLALFFSACGGGSSSSSATSPPSGDTGSIQFNIDWQNAPASESSINGPLPELDCGSAGIATVQAKVYDESNVVLGSGQWNCSAHSGTIADILAGANRTLVIFGQDSQGNNTFVGGPMDGITITPNQTYNAGTITAIPYSITLVSPVKSSSLVSCNFSFLWSATGVNKFQIQIDDDIDFNSPIITQTTTENSYTPADLNSGKYYWRVRGDDGLGNYSKWSEVWDLTVITGIGQPPPAPGGIAAAAGTGQVNITWNSVTGATSYNLYWSTTPGVTKTTGTKISNVTSPYVHTERTNNTTYYYVATAVNSCGESLESSQVSATPEPIPSAPTGVTVMPGDGQVTITWASIAGLTYNIYWSTTSGVTKTNGIKISNVTTPYVHIGRTNGITYYYVVTAVSSFGESRESIEVSATPGRPPAPPTGVTATAGDRQITIAWTNVAGITYNIYWSTTPGVSKVNGTKISNVTTPYIHTGRTNGTTYYYVVTAVNSYGESSESTQVSATPGVAPSAPTGVTATGGNKKVTITWSSVSGATSYNLYWSTTPGVTKTIGTKISNVTSPFPHTGRTSGTTYYYVVTAVNSYGESIESTEVYATAK